MCSTYVCLTVFFLSLFQDTFVIVFSLGTGRVVYASEQAPSILNCKRKFLDSAKFVELLFHQDVNVFYSRTAQPHLPPWNVGTDSGECSLRHLIKSFLCMVSMTFR